MPFLDNIVNGLNEEWRKSSLSFLSGVKAYGIAETMINEVETDRGITLKRYPAAIDNDGEAEPILPEDHYRIILYHKIDSVVNAIAPRTGSGDRYGDEIETANMSLIVAGYTDKVRKRSYEIEVLLKDKIPLSTKITDKDQNLLQTSVFRIGNSSFDKLTILSREYEGVELRLPNIFVFEMKYRIESTYRKGCLECFKN